MLRTVLQETHDAAPVLRVADNGTETQSDIIMPLMIGAVLRNCVREKHNAMRRHGRKALLSAGRHGLIMFALFGVAHAMSGFTMPYILPIVLVSFLLDFLMEWFGCPLWSTPLQRQTALSVNAIAANDPRTLVVLLDALPQIPTRPLFPYYFRQTDYETLFPALATALWNAGDDLPLTVTDTRRARLRGTLNALWRESGDLSTGEADFCAAAIKALAVTGDAKTEWILKKIVASDAPGANHPNRAFVHSLAADVLPLLTERAAEDAAHTKSFRALLHTKNKAVDLRALENFAQSLGEARTQAVAQRYLQSGNRGHRLYSAIVLLLLGATMIPGMIIAIIAHFAGYGLSFSLLPIICIIGTAVAIRSHFSEAASPENQTRMRFVLDYATHTGSPAILPDLLDLMVQPKWQQLHSDKIIAAMNDLKPGDGVYLEARHSAFLRGVVRKRSWWDGTWSDEFVAAATHALTVAEPDDVSHG